MVEASLDNLEVDLLNLEKMEEEKVQRGGSAAEPGEEAK